MQSFESFNLDAALMQNLAQMSYAIPTPVQAKAIPLALQGQDIMGSAQTGTGKTAAFSIPLVQFLLTNPRGSALVLSPTRELAKQIHVIILQLMGAKSALDSALLIGGESMSKQLRQLRLRPRIIVGTPGRVNDHLERGSLLLHDTHFLVLDETDRMLDMGFSVQLDRIVRFLPEKRQTLMFSATLPANIIKLSAKYLHNPQRVAVGSTNVPVKAIKQSVYEVSADQKHNELLKHIRACHGSVVVFVKTKFGADKMAKRLRTDDLSAQAIHGNLNQNKRDRVIRDFRQKKFHILVATDVASRGLDIPHIEHVINYDLPQVPEDYIHRIGRTARAGAEGEAINLITSEDRKKWQAIQYLIDPNSKPPKQNLSSKFAKKIQLKNMAKRISS